MGNRSTIEFDLLGNATDSIERAIDLVAWAGEQDDARRLKQAVQTIAHGVELLLKERLRRVHPALIWEVVDKYPSLSARTVTSDGALSRLISIGGLTFSQKDMDLVRSLRSTRNAIEHYAWTTTKQEAERIVGRALAFALHFAEAELGYEFFGYHTRKDDTFSSLLKANTVFAKEMASRNEQGSSTDGLEEQLCPFCRAVAMNANTGACRLCGHWSYQSKELYVDTPF
jgi:hypothetical protein